MQFKIKSVYVENVVKGRSRYSIAHVIYEDRGQEKQKKIMSFSNPDVFKKVQELVGQTVEVTVGKNDAGYDEWKSIATGNTASASSATSSAPTTRVSGSNYETKEERAARQVLIVKQSSLAQAVEILKLMNPKGLPELKVQDATNLAQELTDWVFATDAQDNSISSMNDDLPF